MTPAQAKERRERLADLDPRRAQLVLAAIHDILWPVPDPDAQWDAETIDLVADVIEDAVSP